MKKLLLSLILFSSNGYSADLQCENSYKTFERIHKEINSVNEGGGNFNLTLFGRLKAKYDYSIRFSHNHPDKVYDDGDWIDGEEYIQNVFNGYTVYKILNYRETNFHFEKPKVNFISSVGEVCVIPFETRYIYFDEQMIQRTDDIFVRDMKSNEWRKFRYLGYEKQEDFDEFFPDFPKSVKLSERFLSKKYSLEQVMDMDAKIYKALDLELSREIIEKTKRRWMEIEERRNENGFR